jgi:VCBS repeat-containing protein
MGLKVVRVTNLIFGKSIYFLAVAAIIFGSVFSDTKVYADEPLPSCSGGRLSGVGNESTFRIVLDCTNIFHFVGSGDVVANSEDLVGIKLHPGTTNESYPLDNRAVIDGDSLSLDFYSDSGSIERNLVIEAGVITNSIGQANNRIEIATDLIVDEATPYADNDYYSGSSHADLIVPVASGLLVNDVDTGGTVVSSLLDAEPLFGDLTLNSDGSFTYKASDSFPGSDSFTYIAVDESGNQSQPATVLIYDDVPVVVGDIYRVGTGDKHHAKVGDEIRVDFASNEPITVDEVRIGGVLINLADVNIVDEMHFSAGMVMQDSDTEGMKFYSVTVHDEFDNYTSMSTETDGVLFDKTAPQIVLNDSEEVEIMVGDAFATMATASDNYDEFVEVVVEGAVDSTVGGVYELMYSATDLAGNQATKMYQTVTVIDNVAPVVDINYVKVDDGWLTVKGTINDPLCDLVITIAGVNYDVVGASNGEWQFVLDVTKFKAGKYKIVITATDLFGNVGQDESTFRIKPKMVSPAVQKPSAEVPGQTVVYNEITSQPTEVDDIDEDNNQNEQTLGASTDNTDDQNQSNDNKVAAVWTFWGIAWYWWLIVGAFVGVIGQQYIAAKR